MDHIINAQVNNHQCQAINMETIKNYPEKQERQES